MSMHERMESLALSADQVLDATEAFREHFGLTVDPRTNPDEFEQAIREVNPRFAGDRKYIDVVRFQLEDDVTDYTAHDKKVIMRAAGALDMLAPETPLVGEFDVIVGLGAARMANYDRLQYAAEALKSGHADGLLIAAGGLRLLANGELEAAASYAPENATTEADLLRGAAEKIGEEYGLEVAVVVVEDERAHNAMIVDAVKQAFPEVRRLAGVTTQIYQVRTALDFNRQGNMLGIETAVAGNPSDPGIVVKRTPATYQSEIAGAQQAAAKHFL